MKRNIFNSLILCVTMVSTLQVTAQGKKDDKTKAFLNFTFEDLLEGDDADISDAGMIYSVKGLGISSLTPADLFHASNDFGVNSNAYGFAKPIDPNSERFEGGDEKLFATSKETEKGNNTYAGIITYKPGKLQDERSYITIPFTDKSGKPVTLIEGKTYCIEMSISMAEASKYATNNIGMMFVDKVGTYKFTQEEVESWEEGKEIKTYIASNSNVIYNYKNKVYDSYAGWDKVCNVYKATKKMDGVIIGNFNSNDPKVTKVLQQTVKKKIEDGADEVALEPMAYYYIDNVIIRLVDNVSECACYNARPPKIEDAFSTLIYDKAPEITDKMTIDKKIEAHSIYFRQGKASLTENAKENMNFVIEQMNANPAMKIEISGNNDELEVKASKENEEYLDLDRKRVAIAVKYFVAQGIAEERIIKTYKGTSTPSTEIVEDDEQDVKDAKCRRVEFRVKM